MAALTTISLAPRSAGSPAQSPLAHLVCEMGTPRFGEALVAYLRELCGADYCSAFRISDRSVCGFASVSRDGTNSAQLAATKYVGGGYWRRDEAMIAARRATPVPTLFRVAIDELGDRDLRNTIYSRIRDRIVLVGGGFCLSILRGLEAPLFADAELHRLGRESHVLFALLSKHAELTAPAEAKSYGALVSLGAIESSLEAMSDLPHREAQVCARILYGLSTVGIALDLEVGTETVKTYRKRAYHRLRIGSQHELLTWYLALHAAPRSETR